MCDVILLLDCESRNYWSTNPLITSPPITNQPIYALTNLKNMFNKKIFESLYWRICLTFLALLLVVGVAYSYIAIYCAEMYYQETNQKLNVGLASSIAENLFIDSITIFKYGEMNSSAINKTFLKHLTNTNPNIEVYLLNQWGHSYSLSDFSKKQKPRKIDIAPVKQFLQKNKDTYQTMIVGENPRNIAQKKVFSAAKINDQGYLYILLGSERYDNVTQTLIGSYILAMSAQAMLLTLVSALVIGLLAIWFLTKNLWVIIQTVKRFEQGDLQARIRLYSKGELTTLANSFNKMADTILANIEELKSTEVLRRELIANVSHDLRTPLAITQGYIETLLMKNEQVDAKERKKYMEIILTSTQKLEKLVSELFALSKLEAKQIKPELEPFFIHELAQDILLRCKVLADEKNIEVHTHVSKDLPLVIGDIALIDRVLQNLIDNAIKFTSENGNIHISIQSTDKQEVIIEIQDTGVGITEAEQAFIFDRYHSKNKAQYTQEDSSGLGLAIVKKILELHDSTIQLKSELGKGSTFFFSLPIYQALDHKNLPSVPMNNYT